MEALMLQAGEKPGSYMSKLSRNRLYQKPTTQDVQERLRSRAGHPGAQRWLDSAGRGCVLADNPSASKPHPLTCTERLHSGLGHPGAQRWLDSAGKAHAPADSSLGHEQAFP